MSDNMCLCKLCGFSVIGLIFDMNICLPLTIVSVLDVVAVCKLYRYFQVNVIKTSGSSCTLYHRICA